MKGKMMHWCKFSLFLLIPLFLISCEKKGEADPWKIDHGKLKVLSTVSMINDLVQRIGGEEIDSATLIQGALDPHSYELVKGDDEKLAHADLIFYNGLGLEHGASLRLYLEKNEKAIALGETLVKRPENLLLLIDDQYDPHIWLDVSLWAKLVDPIVGTLSEKLPQFTTAFQRRGEELKKEMLEADEKIYTLLQAIPSENRYLVTTHDAFRYFTRRYLAQEGEENWTLRCAAPEGVAPESQLSIADVIAIVDYIEKHHVAVLFPESNLNQDVLKKIVNAAQKRGCKIQFSSKCLFADAMGDATSYLEMVWYNVGVISEALTQENCGISS
jgi:manganese/zinc/iron transport system substrate-binding protein